MANGKFNLKTLLRKYPILTWIIVGGVVAMLLLSSIGIVGFVSPSRKDNQVQPQDTRNIDDAQKEVENWLYKVNSEPSAFNYRRLASAYKDVNKLKEALDAASKAKDLDPNNTAGHKLLSEIYLNLDDKESALSEMKDIVALEPNSVENRLNLAMFLQFYSKNSKDAIGEYEKIIEINPNNGEVRQLLVLAYMDQEMYDKAEKELMWMMDKQPGNAAVMAGLAHVYYKEKKYDEAILWYEKAIKIDGGKTGNYYSELAEVYMDKGDTDKGIENYNKALALNPKDPKTMMQLASIYEKQGKKDEAIKELESARTISEEMKDEKLKETINKEIERLGGKRG